ncbi:MAG: TetR/AcrR family transcriptional regulator C-terminal domain-containing protein [Aliidongia sp.]
MVPVGNPCADRAPDRHSAADGGRDPAFAEITAALQNLGVGKASGGLEKWLATKKAQGVLRIGDPAETSARLFWSTAGDLVMQTLLNKGPAATPELIARRVDQVVSPRFFVRWRNA